MYKVNDYVVYKRDVCVVKDIKEKYINDLDYYVLEPLSDKSLKIDVPVLNNRFLRDLISKEEIDEIIKKIPEIEVILVDDKKLEIVYKELLRSEKHEDLIKIIKTSYLRNKDRLDNNKKISEKDNTYFKLAEKFLYNEFSIVLGKTFEETKNYVIDEVTNLS